MNFNLVHLLFLFRIPQNTRRFKLKNIIFHNIVLLLGYIALVDILGIYTVFLIVLCTF